MFGLDKGFMTTFAFAYCSTCYLLYALFSDWLSTKGVVPSPTLAWPGWKQPDIAVEVDTAPLETSGSKNVV
jgi:hypothetical protein